LIKKADLEHRVTERKRLLSELDRLYISAFTGPTPDFPEEDAAEAELQDAESYYEQVFEWPLSHKIPSLNFLLLPGTVLTEPRTTRVCNPRQRCIVCKSSTGSFTECMSSISETYNIVLNSVL